MSVARSSFNFRAVFLPIYHCCLWAFGCFQFGATVYKAAVNIFVLIFGEGGPSTLLLSTQEWDFPGPQGEMLTFKPKSTHLKEIPGNFCIKMSSFVGPTLSQILMSLGKQGFLSLGKGIGPR